jgi:hypothetical protein
MVFMGKELDGEFYPVQIEKQKDNQEEERELQ